MKKISNILVLAALALSACQKQPVIPNTMPLHKAKLTQTMVAADYKKLDTASYGYKNGVFQSEDDAKQTIPGLLTTEYPRVDDGSTADVTFNVGTPQVKVADSVYKNVAYTLTNADYLLLPGNKFTDFTAAQILSWLPYGPKTSSPKANQLAVLTFNYYSGSVSVQTFGYMYLNGAWQQIYLLSPAQYASVGRSNHNEFVATDNVSSVNTYIGALLKADLSVSATAQVGDIQYVSYNYYDGTTDFQKVTAFAFDGSNWVSGSTPRTLSFERASGKWVVSSTVSYTLVKDDYVYIGTQTTAGTQAARDNVAKYPDFNISATTDATYWSDADLNAAMIAVLTEKFKATALPNQKFVVTYVVYSFGKTSNASKTFVFDGTNFVVPQS